MLLLICVACTPPASTPDKPFSLPETQAQNIILQIGQGDAPLLQVKAGEMRKLQRPDSNFTLLRPVKPDSLVYISMYNPDGSVRAEMQMKTLHYFEEPLRFKAIGNIQVKSGEKSLTADTLEWIGTDKRIVSKGFVKIQTATEHIEGYNFSADEDLSNYELFKTTGFFQINKGF